MRKSSRNYGCCACGIQNQLHADTEHPGLPAKSVRVN
jgi:hypothetical protein